ncbi:predicted protein [Plenodomus lingam JN3]|uniref:Uncharacterized protein n=1 Tax=Leptosphaeria maculans (strain JN3 / isolate v23.1.3 / race Av1-4-5-6-7-8) TaxID=985895 RepID=E4ZGI3_LEPMJ|nr:predicted protein [Plenodomus lingam JN3]CBX90403.1 predicted protein [Plenodomus lingam JN3]
MSRTSGQDLHTFSNVYFSRIALAGAVLAVIKVIAIGLVVIPNDLVKPTSPLLKANLLTSTSSDPYERH